MAKNFAINGPFATKFAMDLGGGNLNFHYFPTFPLIWSVFFKLFGVANWVSRLLPVIFSLGSIVVFYKIINKFFDTKTAITACLLWMATPMFIYFGKMPVHEIPLMFFVLLTFWFYLTNNFKGTIFSTIAAMLITWPGFFLVPVLSIFNRRYWILWPIAFIILGLHLTHDFLITGDFFGGGLREIFLLRTSGGNLAWYLWYLETLAHWAWTYYSLLIPLAFLGLVIKRNKITVLFLLYAIIYPFVFRDASSRHDYLLIYFWPFLTLSAALVLKRRLLVILTILIMVYLRWDFIVALQESSLYKESVMIGEFIKDKTPPGETVRIISYDKNIPFDGWFAGYYSNRPVTYTTDTTVVPQKNDFYVFPGGEIKAGAEINNNGIK